MQCPTCGYLLDYLDKECPRCETLRAKGIDPASAKNQLAPATLITCKQCGYVMSGELTSCPQCGHQVMESPTQFEPAKVIIEKFTSDNTDDKLPMEDYWMNLNLKQKITMWVGFTVMALLVIFPPRETWGNLVNGGSRVDIGLLAVRVLVICILIIGMVISLHESKSKR